MIVAAVVTAAQEFMANEWPTCSWTKAHGTQKSRVEFQSSSLRGKNRGARREKTTKKDSTLLALLSLLCCFAPAARKKGYRCAFLLLEKNEVGMDDVILSHTPNALDGWMAEIHSGHSHARCLLPASRLLGLEFSKCVARQVVAACVEEEVRVVVTKA